MFVCKLVLVFRSPLGIVSFPGGHDVYNVVYVRISLVYSLLSWISTFEGIQHYVDKWGM